MAKPLSKAFSRWRDTFLATLANSANVRAACQAAGINRTTAYRWRERSEKFRVDWEEALEDACDVLEAEAWTRARRVSDTLLIFLLKAHRPEKYRETTRHEHAGPDGNPIRLDLATLVTQLRESQRAEHDSDT